MDSEKCKVFLTVVEMGTLSKAADVLGYTVSGVSRNITALEKECGFSLLHRDRAGVTLTSEGKELLPVFREYSRASDILSETVNAVKGLHCGNVTVGVVYADHFKWVTKVIRDFNKEYPEINVNVVQGTSTELIELLKNHRIDFAIASKRSGDFEYIHIQTVQMCACVPKDNPFVGKGVYPLKQLEVDKMIAPYSENETDYAIALRENHIHPNISHVTADVYSAYSMVEAGLGVAFLNRLEPECWDGEVVLLKTNPEITVDIGLMYVEKTLGPSARRFKDNLDKKE